MLGLIIALLYILPQFIQRVGIFLDEGYPLRYSTLLLIDGSQPCSFFLQEAVKIGFQAGNAALFDIEAGFV